MRCLVIDDSPDERSLMERMLKRLGYRATYVSSGFEAIRVLETQCFDIAMCDLGMPAMPGEEVIRIMRHMAPTMRILVVSSFDDKQHVLDALDAGAHGYVLKYELSQKLAPAIQDIMAGRSPMSAQVSAVVLKKLKERLSEAVPRPASAGPSGPMVAGPVVIGPVVIEADEPEVLVDRYGEIEAPGTLPKA